MVQIYRAATAGPKPVPAFTVAKYSNGETYEVRKAKMVPFGQPDKQGRLKHKLEYETVKEKKGFLVSFPAGHSIHVPTFAELERLGFTRTEVPIVDDDGEAIMDIPNVVGKVKEK